MWGTLGPYRCSEPSLSCTTSPLRNIEGIKGYIRRTCTVKREGVYTHIYIYTHIHTVRETDQFFGIFVPTNPDPIRQRISSF